MDRLKADLEGYNDFTLPLRPSWIKKPALIQAMAMEGRAASAVVVTYSGAKLSNNKMSMGVSVRGLPHKAVPFIPSDKDVLCSVCSKWGHSGYNCSNPKEPKCGICSGDHKTTTHKCKEPNCSASIGSKCKHQTLQCPNCTTNRDHRASDKRCPAKKAAIEAAKTDRAERQRKQEEAEKAKESTTAMDVDDGKGKEKEATTETAPPSPVQTVKQTAGSSGTPSRS
jgi:hypothetical protein